MDIRQLRYYKEIVEQGSISKAASALHMAQPPLSMLLKQLEEQYGMPLIKRYRQKWEVTEAGRILYEHALQMLHDFDMIDVKMNYLKYGEEGVIRVGISSSCLHLIGPIMKRFTEAYPRAQLYLTKADSFQIERNLFANEIDVAIILSPNNTGTYKKLNLPSSPFGLAVPEKWYEVLSATPFSLKKLASYPFVLLEAMDGYSMREEIQQYITDNALPLTIVAETKDITLARMLVEHEIGVSILPMTDEKQTSHIRFVDLPQLTTQIQPVLLYKQETELSPICMRFISLFHDI